MGYSSIDISAGRELIVIFDKEFSTLEERFKKVEVLSGDSQNNQFEYKAGMQNFIEDYLDVEEHCCGRFSNDLCRYYIIYDVYQLDYGNIVISEAKLF